MDVVHPLSPPPINLTIMAKAYICPQSISSIVAVKSPAMSYWPHPHTCICHTLIPVPTTPTLLHLIFPYTCICLTHQTKSISTHVTARQCDHFTQSVPLKLLPVHTHTTMFTTALVKNENKGDVQLTLSQKQTNKQQSENSQIYDCNR